MWQLLHNNTLPAKALQKQAWAYPDLETNLRNGHRIPWPVVNSFFLLQRTTKVQLCFSPLHFRLRWLFCSKDSRCRLDLCAVPVSNAASAPHTPACPRRASSDQRPSVHTLWLSFFHTITPANTLQEQTQLKPNSKTNLRNGRAISMIFMQVS